MEGSLPFTCTQAAQLPMQGWTGTLLMLGVDPLVSIR